MGRSNSDSDFGPLVFAAYPQFEWGSSVRLRKSKLMQRTRCLLDFRSVAEQWTSRQNIVASTSIFKNDQICATVVRVGLVLARKTFADVATAADWNRWLT